jgi:hypothetical protein
MHSCRPGSPPKPRRRARCHGELVSGHDEISCLRLGSWSIGNVVAVVFDLGGSVDRSLRRRGQFLVVVGALLGALMGVALGLVVEDARTSTAVAAPGRAHGAVLAASPPSSHPTASRAAGSRNRTGGNESSGNQHAESADRPDEQHSKGHKDREGQRDKPGHVKDKSGKGK